LMVYSIVRRPYRIRACRHFGIWLAAPVYVYTLSIPAWNSKLTSEIGWGLFISILLALVSIVCCAMSIEGSLLTEIASNLHGSRYRKHCARCVLPLSYLRCAKLIHNRPQYFICLSSWIHDPGEAHWCHGFQDL
jgi:hypothetical protein